MGNQVPGGGGSRQDVVDLIIQIAREMGIPPKLALAMAMHESGLRRKAKGDRGFFDANGNFTPDENGDPTSFGLYQLHKGGMLGDHNKHWAFKAKHNIRTALRSLKATMANNPGLDYGHLAAASQRPADAEAYARAINDIIAGASAYVEQPKVSPSGQTPSAQDQLANYFRGQAGIELDGTSHVTSSSYTNTAGGGGGGGGSDNDSDGVKNRIGATGSFDVDNDSGSVTYNINTGGADDVLMPTLSKADFRAGLDAAGFAMALIKSDDELHKIFRKAITQGWYESDTGLVKFQAAIKNTKWWQSRTASQRAYDEQKLNPAEHKTLMDTIRKQRVALKTLAGQAGVDLSPEQLDHMARAAVRNQLTGEQVAHALAKHFSYDPDEGNTGTAGISVDTIQQMAAEYYIPVGNHRMQKWVRQAIAGELDPRSLQDYFKEQASSLFPYLQKQLNAGQTVASIAEPYKQLMARELELDENGIKHNDKLIMQGLQASAKDGQLGLMPLWQYQQMLRNDKRWLKTNNAKSTVQDVGIGILRDMGLSA